MLGCDPLTALLGCGMDVRSPQVVWKRYLRALAEHGAAVRMLAPDVAAWDGIRESEQAALQELARRYPPGSAMPIEGTGVLAGMGQLDVTAEQINVRVAAYYRHIARAVGKELAPALLESGAVTVSAGVHVAGSHLVAVLVPSAGSLSQWRTWAAQSSGDLREAHTAPTLALGTMPGGGIYLFRTPATAGQSQSDGPVSAPLQELSMSVGDCLVTTGDTTVPIPPSRLYGQPVMRLGPTRMLPEWLDAALRNHGTAAVPAA